MVSRTGYSPEGQPPDILPSIAMPIATAPILGHTVAKSHDLHALFVLVKATARWARRPADFIAADLAIESSAGIGTAE